MGAMRLVNGKLVRRVTAAVTNCEDCGSCCRHIGTPPGYAVFYPREGEIPDAYTGSPDYATWRTLPADAEAELRAYYAGVAAGTLFDRSRGEIEAGKALEAIKAGRLTLAARHLKAAGSVPIPCLWYDEESKRCRHYEYRPEVCRTAIQPGDDVCLATRKAFRVPLPVA